ncbi:MAG: BLUF domain-containing protein [Chitinophagaceae bacterium]|nr:BLUF domain-containing protein [Anaerolineae bacterium]
MNLCRLVYLSQRNPAIDVNMQDVMAVSQRNNTPQEITGLLYFDGMYFVQALEGRRSRVTATYNRIAADARHVSLCIVSYTDIRERIFGGWSMALHGGMNAEIREQMAAFFSLSSFDPENVSAESLVYFLQILAIELRRNDDGRLNSLKTGARLSIVPSSR